MPKDCYRRTKKVNKPALTFKDNFWSRKRVEQNVKVKEIAELLGINYKTASAYLTGQAMPHEEYIKTLCEYFDVDLIEGTREFDKAYKSYDAERRRSLKLSAKTKRKIEEKIKPEPKFEEPTSTEDVTEKIAERSDKLFEAVYGNLKDYKEYKAFVEYLVMHSDADVLEWLYWKVDYKTFKKVEQILEE